MSQRENTKIKKNWTHTRENYVNWVSSNKLKSFLHDNCSYEGLSLWWATTLVSKDNVNFPTWYINLKNIFKKKNFDLKENFFFWFLFLFKLIKNLIFKILWAVTIKFISYSRYNKYEYENLFHSYSYDFTKKDNKFVNKLYGKIFSSANSGKNLYLISIIKPLFFLQNYVNFKKNNNSIILDEYISVQEIILTNLIVIKNLVKVLNFIKKEKNIFHIKKKNCENILKPLFINSFCGEIQNSILMAKSVGNFLHKKRAKNFVTYGEFTPLYRPTYFYIKKCKNRPNITAFQHGHANFLYNFNKKNEFSKNENNEGTTHSPAPDKYFVQGYNFYKNLKKFYKGKLQIIGAPRYDSITFKRKYQKIEGINKKKKNILICTSVGDQEDILEILSKSVNVKYNYILSPHPDNKEKVFSLYKKKYKSKINLSLFKNYNTAQLIQISDLVITGLSHACIEAQLIGIPSIRIANPNKPDYLDHKDQITVIYSSNDLKKVLKKKNFLDYRIKKLKKLERDYFFRLDNKAYKRFWKYL